MTTAFLSDRSTFSLKRIAQLYTFYAPAFNRQLLVYLSMSIIEAILLLLPFSDSTRVGIFSIIVSVQALMFELSPIVLCKSGDCKIIENLLPVSSTERFIFYLLYFLVAIPIATFLIPDIVLLIIQLTPALQTSDFCTLIEIRYLSSKVLSAINILTPIGAILTCLYVVLKSKRNRILKGVGSVFIYQTGIGIIGAVWGATWAFKAGIKDGIQGLPPDPVLSDGLPKDMMIKVINDMTSSSEYTYTTAALLLCYVILFLILNYKAIRKSNI